MQHNAIIKSYAQRLYAKGKHEGIVMNNVKNKVIHIIFKMVQTQTLWEQEYQQRHKGEDENNTEEYKIGATEAAPMINEISEISTSIYGECTYFEEKKFFSCIKT